ncbi:MAG: hypothetical protein HQK97_05665 [Nitrospirae bacterium]|nr:hypothetical protein [Nitrospirota bacterium]
MYRREVFTFEIAKKYVVDDNNNRVAVKIDIETFGKIEEILENYGLHKLMRDDNDAESLNLEQAKEYYSSVPQ